MVAEPTEPTMNPAMLPSPGEPMTSIVEERAAAARASEGGPATSRVVMSRSGCRRRSSLDVSRSRFSAHWPRISVLARRWGGCSSHSVAWTSSSAVFLSSASRAAQWAAAVLAPEPSRPTVTWLVMRTISLGWRATASRVPRRLTLEKGREGPYQTDRPW